MQSERFIRSVLWVAVGFNLLGAMAFLFPETVGQLSALPVPVPRLYAWLLASMVLMFGGMYAWLAMQLEINRALLAIGAIGKALVFCVFTACWLLGDVPFLAILGASGDLILAGLFTNWLIRSR
ncbi:MAG: hypothetical protein KDA93_09015 [Planctomycetaceae bacterium]|nr:hypothetical protein [Planctomycetaceae bacterium]